MLAAVGCPAEPVSAIITHGQSPADPAATATDTTADSDADAMQDIVDKQTQTHGETVHNAIAAE